MPSRDLAATFYGSGYWGEQVKPGLLNRLQAHYVATLLRWDLMRWFNRMNIKPAESFLDFGCSRGDWLALIAKRGVQAHGIDGDPRAVEYARNTFGLDVSCHQAETWDPAPDQLAGMAALHVLEHTHEPLIFLQKCHRALRQEGRLLLRVPNLGSWQATWTGTAWKGLEAPRHLWQFTLPAIRKLLSDAGFQVDRVSTWSWRDGPPGLSSSLFAQGEPTRQKIMGRARPLATLFYLALTWALTPVEGLAAALQKGGMLTVVARKS
ncbi:MAG: class I SAM-dependent methyltransferase [Acidobacteria bacterium]|nr:class I SAM-dependent methyltransferase [Acidobacteriota bacterium]